MKATVVWKNDLSFSATTESGYKTVMDGNGKAISPMESVLTAVGACSSIDIADILKKGRFDITDCRCELDAQRAENPPKVFEKIHAHYLITGTGLTDKAVQRSIDLSVEKYCSVMLMLKGNVEITTSYELIDG